MGPDDVVREPERQPPAASLHTCIDDCTIRHATRRSPEARGNSGDIDVIVSLAAGSNVDPTELVEGFDGTLKQPLTVINGFSAVVPRSAVSNLQQHPDVASVVTDGSLTILDDSWEDARLVSVSKVDEFAGSLKLITEETIDADEFWEKVYDGSGVDIALIDSDVVPVTGLDGKGKIINDPDLSFESQADEPAPTPREGSWSSYRLEVGQHDLVWQQDCVRT
ncbi:MAG: protease inhibitor I9 family protein [Actinomycetota bacterium]|nr:protease inhibitor I9 family protein [Actinomycetota bacterium]